MVPGRSHYLVSIVGSCPKALRHLHSQQLEKVELVDVEDIAVALENLLYEEYRQEPGAI